MDTHPGSSETSCSRPTLSSQTPHGPWQRTGLCSPAPESLQPGLSLPLLHHPQSRCPSSLCSLHRGRGGPDPSSPVHLTPCPSGHAFTGSKPHF